jgi:hypothetical protein
MRPGPDQAVPESAFFQMLDFHNAEMIIAQKQHNEKRALRSGEVSRRVNRLVGDLRIV